MSLTLQFIPYIEIEDLDSEKRITKLLKIVKANKIILLEGRLKGNEETELIRRTMEEIDDKFKGIELSVIFPDKKDEALFRKLKSMLIQALMGDRKGFTIIGPATIVKEIKQDPDKIQLFTEDLKIPRKKR
ncbi:DUF2073 domain-containing protein [Candidatus Woesearchaeota archaeon]|nr:DUF2073 domain-containing protein [Candidatus Woesearchaeota archaeon]